MHGALTNILQLRLQVLQLGHGLMAVEEESNWRQKLAASMSTFFGSLV